MTHYAPLTGALTATLVLAFILTLGKRLVIHDVPNERSLHEIPVPRIGGVGLIAGLVAGWLLVPDTWIVRIMLPMLGLFALSLADDAWNLSPRLRLVGHFIAALIAVSGMNAGLLWFIPLVLFTVWMTNLYNFMDGSDGLAGGMALFGFGSYGLGAWLAGHESFAMLNWTIAAAAFCFLLFNFHPAKIFMGDAGSIPLGFLAATFGIFGWKELLWPIWFPFLVFSPFIVDATITLFKRMRRGEKLSQAHRSHYYQRLVRIGWGHRNTALAEYTLMSLACATALCGINLPWPAETALLLLWLLVYAALAIRIDRHWQASQSPGN